MTVQELIVALFSGDTELTAAQPGGLEFMILDKFPKFSGRGSTPEAFRAGEGSPLKRVIYVPSGDRVPHPGEQPGNHAFRWDTFPVFQLFAEPNAAGKQALDKAILRIEELLWNYEGVIYDNQRVSFRPAGNTAPIDSDRFEGNKEATSRWRATGSKTF